MAKQKNEVEQPEEKIDQIDALLESKEFKGSHLGSRSGEEIVAQDIITTGSFFFDLVMDGGFRSGSWARFYGDAESGKTSQGLRWGANWQRKYPDDGFVLIFNAEGRITKDLLDRSGINYKDKNKFRLIDSNISDFIFSFTQKVVIENPEKRRYFVIIDSTDSCERALDREKMIGDAEKIAGGAAISSVAGKRLSLYFNRNNHFLYMTSQLRDRMTMGPGQGGGKTTSGGNAPRFYSSLTGYIKKPTDFTESFVYEDEDAKNKIRLGTIVNILLDKTPNEKTGQTVTFPVKVGQIGGIWESYEAMLICRDLVKTYSRPAKTGSYVIEPEFAQDLTEQKIPFEPSLRSDKRLREMFDNNPELSKYVLDKYRKLFIKN